MNSQEKEPIRPNTRFTLVLALTLVTGGLIGTAVYRSRPPAPFPLTVVEKGDELDAAAVAGQSERQQAATPRAAVPVRRSAPEISSAAAEPARQQIPPSPEAQEAVARLSRLEPSNKPLTLEQATAIKDNLKQLVSQGAGAVSAIHQFLDQNKDLSLDEIKGGSPVGYSSLRAGLFDALHQIGGAEVQSALRDVLRTTGDPAEVELLARHLEELAPGQYREDAVNAARETLATVAEGKMKVDVGPLFQVLQNFGDANVVGDLQKALPQWPYYGSMALAGLPDGKGVSALIEQGANNGTFALQMLAQVATQYPEATSALLEQAKSGRIPDSAWRRVAEALAGDQYRFVKEPGADLESLMRIAGTKTYHIGKTDENFYSVPITSGISEEELAQRRNLVDQLLAATSSPAAAEALQKAKSQLGNPGH